jgi:hypothetical protein
VTSQTPPDHSLTDAEAIARFKELDAVRLAMFDRGDRKMIDHVFVVPGPAAKRAAQGLAQLRRQNLTLHHPVYRILDVQVTSNSPEEIKLRQVLILRTQTRPSRGQVAADERLRRQVVTWTMKTLDGSWFIFDGAVRKARFIGEKSA